MRPEAERWFLQAKEELSTAQVNLDCRKFFAAAFWSQQAVEKALKALYLHKKKESAGPTHSLTRLGRDLEVPAGYYSSLRDLTKEYFMSRYPDATEDVPYMAYTEEDAKNCINTCKNLLKWVEQQLKK